MYLKLDTVSGHEIDQGVYSGRILRTGLVIGLPLGFGSFSNQNVLIQALSVLGMPQIGDPWNASDPLYKDYFVKRINLRAISATQAIATIQYEYLGLLTISDSTTISSVTTQLHPKDFKPLYVRYTPAGGTVIKKLVSLQSALPLRHLTFNQTIDHMASTDVINAFGTVNDQPWQGLPIGYWLFSDIDGYTQDNGITYTYTAIFTTKQRENWLQLGYMEDDTGQPIIVPEASVAAIRSQDYFYGQDTSVDGVLVAGLHDLSDFFAIFGV